MSKILSKRWILSDLKPTNELLENCSNPLVAQILASRGIETAEEARFYLAPDGASPGESNAYEIPQMKLAVDRIEKALAQGEKIFIYGDYDVDGTTSTALLYDALTQLGANVHFYIPNRLSEGYGLNSKAVVKLRSTEKARLLITCDCGITNYDEVSLAQQLGLDVIVTDHHSLPEKLPPAIAVLNPKLLPNKHPLHWLPGVGVAYKLAKCLLIKAGLKESVRSLLDLVALGIIADLAPLRAENRLLAKEGLKVLGETRRPGLKALLVECGQWSNEEGVGFALAPRINAAGRLSDANQAVRLFLSTDPVEAQRIAQELTEQNRLRQEMCEETFMQAVQRVEQELDPAQQALIALADERWHHGVVGIVASRLVEKYHVPVFLAVIDQDKVKGSARSIPGIDLAGTITKFGDLLERYGGHQAAAGYSLSLERWGAFKEGLSTEFRQILTDELREPRIAIDAELKPEELTLDQFEAIWSLAPYGMGFPKPVFMLHKPASLLDVKPLGAERNHSRLFMSAGEINFEALHWRTEPKLYQEALNRGSVEIAFTPNKNFFRGKPNLQLEVRDWKLAETMTPKPGFKGEKILEFHDMRHQPASDRSECANSPDTIIWEYGNISQIAPPSECLHLILRSIPLVHDPALANILQQSSLEKVSLIGINLTHPGPDLKTYLRRVKQYCLPEKSFTLSSASLELETRGNTLTEALAILQQSGALEFSRLGDRFEIIKVKAPSNTQLKVQRLRDLLEEEQELKKALKYMAPFPLIAHLKNNDH